MNVLFLAYTIQTTSHRPKHGFHTENGGRRLICQKKKKIPTMFPLSLFQWISGWVLGTLMSRIERIH